MIVRRQSELSKDERRDLGSWVYEVDDRLKDTHKGTTEVGRMLSGFGICSMCRHLEYSASEFTILHANCLSHSRVRTQKDPVKFCTDYSERGAMTLSEMKEIAIIIDLDPPARVGF